MTEEMIELINKIDTANYVTYLYGSIFLISTLALIYVVMAITITLITKKKQNKWLDNQSAEIQNAVRKYKNINVFTSKGNLNK